MCYIELRRTKLEGLSNPAGFTGQVKSLSKVWSYLYFKGERRCKDTLRDLEKWCLKEW